LIPSELGILKDVREVAMASLKHCIGLIGGLGVGEQAGAELLLQRLHMGACHGRGHVEAPGGRGKAAHFNRLNGKAG
jgi:hypothetical protein